MKPSALILSLCSLAFLPAARAALLVDFSSPTAFADNFRSTLEDPNTTTSQDGNTYVSTFGHNPESSGGAEIFLYDTTPADTSPATRSTFSGASIISFDIRAAQANSSFAILIVDPANEGNASHQYGLFNFDNVDPAGDRIRIGSGAEINSGGIGTVAVNASEDTPVTIGTAFTTATLTYSQGANNAAVLTFSVGSFSRTATLGNNTYLSTFEIAFRSFDANNVAGGGVDITNFNVSPVPEVSSLALLGLASAGLLASRRR